jgi:hypothetical protein
MLLDMKQIDDEIGEDMGYRGFANSAEENVKTATKCVDWCQRVSLSTLGPATTRQLMHHKISCIRRNPCSKVLSNNLFGKL